MLPLLAVVVVAAIVVPLLLLAHLNSQLDRVDAFPSGTRPANTPGTTWLITGSDSRAGLSKAQRHALSTGNVPGQRTDTIMLFHVPNNGTPPTLVSLPRDSLVTIPAHRTKSGKLVPAARNKLNAAFAFGGPQLLVQTVEGATGLRVDRYLQIGLGGLVKLVDAVGGITICPTRTMNDPKAGLYVKPGCQHADGAKALAYSRARYSDPLGDLGRVQRQREVVSQIVKRSVGGDMLLHPLRTWQIANAGVQTVTVDRQFSMFDAWGLAMAMRKLGGPNVVKTTVPIANPGYSVPGIGDTVLWDRQAALTLFHELRDNKPVTLPKAG